MPTKPKFWRCLHGLAALTLVGAALYFLLVEHRAHTLQYLPFLIILLCPLMHIFMHKGHGSGEIEKAYHRGLEEGRKASRK